MQKCEAAAAKAARSACRRGKDAWEEKNPQVLRKPAAHWATGTERASKYSLFTPTAAAAAATGAACREQQEASGTIAVVQTQPAATSCLLSDTHKALNLNSIDLLIYFYS